MSEMRKNILSKKVIRKAYLNWMFFHLSVQNMERMEGPAIVKMLADIREDLYPNDLEAQKEMLKRHSVFFNTEPNIGSIVPGIVLGMEAEKASGQEVSEELINAIKTALIGPFAGIGDSLVAGTICPILLSIAMGMCKNGEIMGPIFYVIAFLGIMIPLTWFLFSYGCKTGANAAQMVLAGGIKDKVTKAAEVIGLVVVGAVTASYASVNIGLKYTSGDMNIDVASIIDTLMPKLPVLLMAFLTYYLIMKRKWSINKIMLFLLVVAIIGYFANILVV